MDVGAHATDMNVHHVGIATDDADSTVELYVNLFDTSVVHREEIDGVSVVFLDAETGYLEFLEPLEEGTITRFLEGRGPGIHHVAFETPDIEGALAAARDIGIEPVDESPRPGAWGSDVAFLHPGSTGGVLIELVDT